MEAPRPHNFSYAYQIKARIESDESGKFINLDGNNLEWNQAESLGVWLIRASDYIKTSLLMKEKRGE